MKNVYLPFAMLLAACTTGANKVKLQDGSDGYTIWCKGPMGCYQKAGDVCSHGYDVLDKSAQSRPYVAAYGPSVAAGTNESFGLLIRCK